MRRIGDQKKMFRVENYHLPGPSAATRTAPPLLAALLGREADDFASRRPAREVETGACLGERGESRSHFFRGNEKS